MDDKRVITLLHEDNFTGGNQDNITDQILFSRAARKWSV